MKIKMHKESGQALILIAIAAIGLLAIVALAIDGSATFSDRRHAQNAADTAALAGALAKVNSHRNADDSATTWTKIVNAAKDQANANGYNGDLVTSTVEVYNPPTSGVYSNCSDLHFDCNDYVQVIINSTVNTYFAHIIGIPQTHNRVEAIAKTIEEDQNFNFGGNAIVALSPTDCPALAAAGTTDVVVNGGGMFSNSDCTPSFKKTTCSGTIDINDSGGGVGGITMVGGYQINTSCWDPTKATLIPGGSKQLSFPPPYDELPEPAECSTAGSYTVTGSGSNKTATLQPGNYSALPVSSNWKNMILNPGVYCIDTSLSVQDSLTMASGSTAGVLLYFKSSSVTNVLTVNASANVNIWGINADNDSSLSAYKSYLMYFSPNYSLSSAQNCTINGSATSTYSGTIYAPYCNLKINGNSGMTMQSQLIGYTVDLSGASGITLNYDSAPKTVWPISNQVGLHK